MEEWEIDFHYLEVRHNVKEALKLETLPELKVILFFIGIQEFGRIRDEFTKEEKRDLMHVAACRLLEEDGYYKFDGRDGEGWPHWEVIKPFKVKGVKEQERILKEKVIQYFKDYKN